VVPRVEPLSRYGNPPFYEVNGQRYQVMREAVGFEETGVGSWYGSKFHGRRTSSGEIFDMYQFTAAHPRLPLPSFVEVTNLENNRSLIVRVNDRGPFAHNRVIDLSYAAAKQLGYSEQGTARMQLRVITPELADQPTPEEQPYEFTDHAGRREHIYLQLGAFGDADNARALGERLKSAGYGPIVLDQTMAEDILLHRLRIGPLDSTAEADNIAERLAVRGIQAVIVVQDDDAPTSPTTDNPSSP
jgi:rare lipoprotein A